MTATSEVVVCVVKQILYTKNTCIMKKMCTCLAFLLQFLFLNGQEPGKCKFIIYRPYNYHKYSVPFRVIINDTLKIKIRNNSFYELTCNAGEYDFTFLRNKKFKLHLAIENGKTYYLRVGIIAGFWSSSPELLLVDSLSTYPVINNGKIEKLKSKNEIMLRPQNRIGVNVISGIGFEEATWFKYANGGTCDISFGAGIGYEVIIGREFSRFIDLSAGIKYQKSSLVPKVENVEITFKRYAVSLTPSLIIPIKGGDYERLKLGVGMDYVWPSVLYLNTVKYQFGIIDNWTYDRTLGMHVRLLLEINFSKYFSLQYGLRWNYLSYKFVSGNITFPIVSQLKNPDGSGIDLLLGFNIHF